MFQKIEGILLTREQTGNLSKENTDTPELKAVMTEMKRLLAELNSRLETDGRKQGSMNLKTGQQKLSHHRNKLKKIFKK